MKSFISKTIQSSIPFLCLLIGVNYYGDASHIFHSGYEKKIATLLSEGNNVTNISNYNERILQKEFIKQISTHPDIIILGSSRTMLLNNDNFKSSRVLNSSVSGASIQDIIAIYQLYKNQYIYPKKIIIGIDPYTFNKNNTQNRWRSLRNEYNTFHNIPFKVNTPPYLELISPSYFQQSIQSLIKRKRTTPTKNRYNINQTKLADGSLEYSSSFRKSSKKEITDRVNSLLNSDIKELQDFNSLSPALWLDFTSLVSDLKKQNINIEIFLTPVHPLLFDKLKQKYPIAIATEDSLITYANKNHIKIHGTFNPYRLDFTTENFYDAIHCNKEAIKYLLKE